MKFPHHYLVRRRARREPYPASKAWLRLIDRLVLICGLLGPVFTIPQLIQIYWEHHASGVSALSWGAYAVLDFPWLLYGIVHRERPIIITYLIWLILNTVVCVGALLYG